MSYIKTTYTKQPIPDRKFDWEAIREDYDAGDPIGRGATEKEAINDLLENETKCNHPRYMRRYFMNGSSICEDCHTIIEKR